jgi:glucan 1,3-beta-glucosidase
VVYKRKPRHELTDNSYYQAYNLIRGITGYGADNGPIMVIHEGFEGIASWNGFMAGADRM